MMYIYVNLLIKYYLSLWLLLPWHSGTFAWPFKDFEAYLPGWPLSSLHMWMTPFILISLKVFFLLWSTSSLPLRPAISSSLTSFILVWFTAFRLLSQLEGIIPALETSHAIAYLEVLCPALPDQTRVVINCSGRGDKDVQTAIKHLHIWSPNKFAFSG